MRSSSAPHLDEVSSAPQSLHIGDSTGFSSTAVAQHSGLCLEDPAQSTANGTQYQQNTCGSGQEQRFDFRPVSGATDTYTVVNHSSGTCLDISAYSIADGAAVQQWTCHGGTNQRFQLNAVTSLGSSHDYQLVALNSGKCVDVSNISTTAGARAHQTSPAPMQGPERGPRHPVVALATELKALRHDCKAGPDRSGTKIDCQWWVRR